MHLIMSSTEREQLVVVGRVQRGKLTQREAAVQLGISEPRVRRSLRRPCCGDLRQMDTSHHAWL